MTEREIFFKALDIKVPAERVEFLERLGDVELRRRVEALLKANEEAGGLLDEPNPAAKEITPTEAYVASTVSEEKAGDVIAGRFRLLERIGEGGMGAVWMADQTEPVKRRVAVKLIRAERANSKLILARFEAERQAIALMDHPHIAKLLDAGTTEAGAPFFVMELVKGVPLTDFCDEHRLSVADRLSLFIQICSAVQHAHQKGIIHRDLKPTNILVESHDDKPVPKVIDFGLAKAMSGQPLTDRTLFTGFGTVAGTPLYMAPEQAKFNALDVDTRADIYALGVILYELLTGTTPIERARFKQAALDEMLRLVRENEPPTPSKRLSSAESKPSVAATRSMEPAKLRRYVRGELDWIVMKALSKERDRRYESANGFAKDVERFLNQEPVQAGPPSATYRLRKFLTRNKGLVVAAGSVFAALLVGIAATTWQAYRAIVAEAHAEERRKEVEKAEAYMLADYRASTDDAIEHLISSKPELGLQEKAYLENTLKRWQAYAGRQGDDERSRNIRGEGHTRVGYLWAKLGRWEEARTEYQSALSIKEKLAADFPGVHEYRHELAASHNIMGQLLAGIGERPEAEEHHGKALTIQEKLAFEFPDLAHYQMALANTHTSLGLLLAGLNNRPEAEKHYRLGLAIQEKLAADFPAFPEYRHNQGLTHNNLAGLLASLGNRLEAEEQYRKALAIQEKLAADFPASPNYRQVLAVSYSNLGLFLTRHERRFKADEQYRKALAIREKLATDYPSVPLYQVGLGNSFKSYGISILEGGSPTDSLKWFDQAISSLRLVHEKEPRDVNAKRYLCNSYVCRAQAYEKLQKFSESAKDWDRVVELSLPGEQFENRASRATLRLKAGMIAQAAADVVELAKSANWNGERWYQFACICSVASGKYGAKKKEHADRAMEMLQKAVQAGFKDGSLMKTDADLDPLRSREDFKKLISDLK